MTDLQLQTAANVIKNETLPGANTETRVGTMLNEIIGSKINNDKIVTTVTGASDANVPSEKAVKAYSDAATANVMKTNVAQTNTSEKVFLDSTLKIRNSTDGGNAVVIYDADAGDDSIVVIPDATYYGGTINMQIVQNKSNDETFAANSDTLYPSQKAVKTYADGLVVGLLDDRGNYNASVNTFPTTGGSGIAGAVKKGDLWYISVAGTLGGVAVQVGSSIRALIDNAGQTNTNWGFMNVGLGFVPENVVNKSTNITADTGSNVKYTSVKAVEDYVAANVGGVFVKTYYLVVSQNGNTAPDIIQSINPYGITFNATYVSQGWYRISASNLIFNPNNKNNIQITKLMNGANDTALIGWGLYSSTDFYIKTIVGNTLTDGCLNSQPIKIEVYS